MRRSYALGLAVASLLVAVGCNNGGSKTSSRVLAAAAAITSGSTNKDAPKITSVSPSNGPVDGGTAVIISGSNFTKSGAGTTMVLFGSQAVVVTPQSDTEILVIAPRQAQAGAVEVRVINDIGQGIVPAAFTYDPPQGFKFTPAVGSVSPFGNGGTRITLDTRAFVPLGQGVTVDFGAVRATTVTVVDQDTVVAEVPTGVTPGLTPITITQGGASITAQGFRVQGTLTYGDVVINEVLFDPASTDANNDEVVSTVPDEFIELVNTTANPIDLTYVILKDNNGTGQTPVICHRFVNPTTIPAGGSIVVFGGGMPNGFAERHLSGSAQTSTSTNGSLGLANAGETLTVEDQHGTTSNTLVYKVALPTQTVLGASWVLKTEGARITTNPATSADYEAHPAHPTRTSNGVANKHSAGTKRDGTAF